MTFYSLFQKGSIFLLLVWVLFLFIFIFIFFLLSFFVVCSKKIKSMNQIEPQTRARQEPFDFISVRVADEKKKLHPCAIQLCDK